MQPVKPEILTKNFGDFLQNKFMCAGQHGFDLNINPIGSSFSNGLYGWYKPELDFCAKFSDRIQHRGIEFNFMYEIVFSIDNPLYDRAIANPDILLQGSVSRLFNHVSQTFSAQNPHYSQIQTICHITGKHKKEQDLYHALWDHLLKKHVAIAMKFER